ncbi:hypothetical protein [Sedimenticola selenatireducens]|uniref:Uncharacterized protein n=1 Tax=Sedimenticola selenatireducens TaxID=191960 RepID=A0A558DW49_9GAMM|nr:hypothetical protein [Sedimenticola selenatireducens]TVO77823.1 hypothetical protein FHP88_03215 [Sedimenticola selenatireducens]TVT65128.1 MAG: hypothetical protein FHK78_05580 [Sedimenticola selenatireducens]
MEKASHLLNLTKGLIYPAFLGAALLWFSEFVVNYIDKDHLIGLLEEPIFYLATWYLLYFFVPFTNLYRSKFVSNYRKSSFALDLIDVLIIFLAFYNLGLVGDHPANLDAVYILLIFIPAVGLISNDIVNNWEYWKVALSMTALLLFLLFGLIGSASALTNFFFICILYSLLLFYLLFTFDS